MEYIDARILNGIHLDATDRLLTSQELDQIEKVHPSGLTSAQIIQIFRARGVKFSEAAFRRYVQLGILPRSRRVGTKGKHRGSHGVYPCTTVRQINELKRLLASGYTLEEIAQSVSGAQAEINLVEATLEKLFIRFEREIAQPQFDLTLRRSLARDIDVARQTASTLVRQVIDIDSRFSTRTRENRFTGGGVLARTPLES